MMSDACAAMVMGEGELWGWHDFQRLKALTIRESDGVPPRTGKENVFS
jgi:hypothetical protein